MIRQIWSSTAVEKLDFLMYITKDSSPRSVWWDFGRGHHDLMLLQHLCRLVWQKNIL